MKEVEIVARHQYTGISVCGCTAFAVIGKPKRRHDRALGWVIMFAAEGPCHPNGLEVLDVVSVATEADAVSSIENGDWPGVCWVSTDGLTVG